MAFMVNSSDQNERTSKEAPKLCALSLDSVRSKVQALTLNDKEGIPEKVREVVGAKSSVPIQYREKMMKRARQEGEISARVPLKKAEESRNRLVGLLEDFYNEVRSLPLNKGPSSFSNSNRGAKKQSKRWEMIG
ncbi:hypothetical protein C5167_007358 [Papaver somniferum]|uniref:uncharacterized protein LOC113344330 n=1 Tax=Papaver somniferum TaxID=3469 RepID=UPI000E6FFF19|nr:uncharacterized protein LOC113344330 [Papaver somniferum]XP_026444117.1 uncharacterized protein LOC113344330 [Papaver somniferum]RZC93545.1 hypothetical protein C5167_007358 [Papaver somniferum]